MANINGTIYSDIISPTYSSFGVIGGTSTSSPDTIYGLDGDDTIDGGAGGDLIFGGPGNDSLNGGIGSDYIDGGDGNDTLVADTGYDTLIGGAGNDLFLVNDFQFLSFVPVGGIGLDTILVLGGSVVFENFFNNDIEYIYKNGGFSLSIFANDGLDQLFHSNFLDFSSVHLVSGSAIFGDFSTDLAKGGNDTIIGSSQSDIIVGAGGNDSLVGGTGNDSLFGGLQYSDATLDGSDTIDGGDGDSDFVFYYSNNINEFNFQYNGISIILKIGTITDIIINCEYIQFKNSLFRVSDNHILGSNDSDTIAGSNSSDYIEGLLGADLLTGNAGNDTLDGGAGADSLQGGDNNDTLYFDGLDVIVQGGNGTDIAIRNDGQSAFGFAMAANGIEELRWDLNGDSYVATLNIATGDIRVVANDGGPVNSDWASFTTDYTGAWAPKVQQGTYDTGGLWSINYDFAGNQIFIDYTTVYKAGGILWYQSGRYDNGTTWSINWDTENAGDWRDYTTQYDALGRATVQTGTYDDGRKWSINWDVADAGNWREYTTVYNAAGVAISQSGIYDNGTTWSIVF